ncbi:hypothetical protein [Spirochaeta cellobiosiphila]|uniref:hypothetical protein n=1 Tax=Spirochaeta cellobiosiphila TaxID=504483 RepID=UPI0004010B7E|nr:hypothetical protein [Spirochaeta cellobiosiphila]
MSYLLFVLLAGNALFYYGLSTYYLPLILEGRRDFGLKITGNTLHLLGLTLVYWPISHFVLVPYELDVLDFPVILIIYGFSKWALMYGVRFYDASLKEYFSSEPYKWGDSALITAYLLFLTQYDIALVLALVGAILFMLGLWVAVKLVIAIRDRYELEPPVPILQGLPILFLAIVIFSTLSLVFSWLIPTIR